MNMNVTDLRGKLRRSPINRRSRAVNANERRKTSDRRVLPDELNDELNKVDADVQRIWLTPGERTLIEDLYLLDEK
jgi:hypothetical protein